MVCTHSFYNKFTLDYGSVNPALNSWVSTVRSRLWEGHVVRVGVHGTGEFADGSYLKIEPPSKPALGQPNYLF